MRSHNISVLPGDGIGDEVVREGLRVLDVVAAAEGFKVERTVYPYGADHYLATGEDMPEQALEAMAKTEAILLGAIGDPRVETGFLERKIIWGVRQYFDLFVNLRPVKLYSADLCPLKDKGPDDVDLIVVRENTEDAYAGLGGIHRIGTPHEVAIAEMIYTRNGVERVIRYSFELAKTRNKGGKPKVTLVDKSNAIRAQDIWTRTFAEVASEYPGIETDHAYIDAACMWMVKNPEYYDVIVTTNMFGDIITDLGAMIQGGMGVAAGGNINPDQGGTSMYEPMGGSAPKYTGQNVINPIAAISAMGMLLEHSGQPEAGARVLRAIELVTGTKMKGQAAGKMGYSTTEVGDLVCEALTAV